MGSMLLGAGVGLCIVAVVAALVVTPDRPKSSGLSEQLPVIEGG